MGLIFNKAIKIKGVKIENAYLRVVSRLRLDGMEIDFNSFLYFNKQAFQEDKESYFDANLVEQSGLILQGANAYIPENDFDITLCGLKYQKQTILDNNTDWTESDITIEYSNVPSVVWTKQKLYRVWFPSWVSNKVVSHPVYYDLINYMNQNNMIREIFDAGTYIYFDEIEASRATIFEQMLAEYGLQIETKI